MDQAVTRISFEAYGVPCDLVMRHACDASNCVFPGLAEGVMERLPPGWQRRDPARAPVAQVSVVCRGGHVEVTDGDGAVTDYSTESTALHVIDGAIRAIVAVHAPGVVFVHAGVVAFDGRAVVLPGRSMAGKTTLVAALVEAGATYLSDEYAVFDTSGAVHPYPRRLSLRTEGGRREVSAAELGGTVATSPLPVAAVLAIEYRPEGTWNVVAQGQAACADALLSNAVAAQIRPVEVLSVAASVARSVPFFSGTRGETAEAVERVRELAAIAPSDALATGAGARR